VRRCVAGLPGYQLLDSLAVQANGDVCVATIPLAITTISPNGDVVSQLEVPDEIPTNICFGGPDLKQAYVTLSSTGRLYAVPWDHEGLRLEFAR
jgi:gluconolactonase